MNFLRRLVLAVLSGYLRYAPWEKGRWRLLSPALKLSKTCQLGGQRAVKTRYGFRLGIDLADWLGRHVYVTGEYEPATSQVIQALLPTGGTMVDIGGNIGYFSMLSAQCVGPSGKVFAFEPLPSNRQRLEANVLLNGYRQVVVNSTAVCERNGEATFHEGPANHRGLSSLRPLAENLPTVTVQTGRLDDLLPKGIRINLVKIDVEGAEGKVLEGMQDYLRRDHPDLVLEISDNFLRALGDTADGLCQSLFRHGYRMYEIEHDGLRPIAAWSADLPPQFNALFSCRSALPLPIKSGVSPMGEQ